MVYLSNNHHLRNALWHGSIQCNELKPDLVGGPFDYDNKNNCVVSCLDTESLHQIAEFLSKLEVCPGTRVHPLPFVLGEVKTDNGPYKAEDL